MGSDEMGSVVKKEERKCENTSIERH